MTDLLVACDHDQAIGTDDGQPLVVERTAGYLGQLGVAGVNDVTVLLGQGLPKARSFSSTKNLAGKGSHAASERNCSCQRQRHRSEQEHHARRDNSSARGHSVAR
jgi:hypothetical protein